MNPTLKKSIPLSLGIVFIILWVSFFTVGLTMNSQPYREALAKGFNLPDFFYTMFLYTPTNIAILAILSGGLGAFAQNIANGSNDNNAEKPALSMMRGFVTYVVFIAGIFIFEEKPFAQTTAEQYTKLAGVISLLSISIGYDPSKLQAFFKVEPKDKKDDENNS